MSNLLMAATTNDSRTTNGAVTNSTTSSFCLDFFSTAAASRGKTMLKEFKQALAENADIATKILFWLRDIRGGAGERKMFRDLVTSITTAENALSVMSKTVEVGRWDDLQVFLGTKFEDLAVSITADALVEGNALAAKWTPRKGQMFNLLRKKMELTPKELRKMLVSLSNTVEQLMSSGRFNEIDYSKLPSVASARYMTAFHKNDSERYQQYKDALVRGDKGVKINAGAVYPYDIVKSIKYGNRLNVPVAEAQWAALPNYMENVDRRVVPVIDVSGSMSCSAGGSSVTCMDVAVSLGLYLAERNKSIFNEQFITFHSRPTMMSVKGLSLSEKLNKIYTAPWGMNTNLIAVFDLILNAATKANLPQSDMPTDIIIFSDMEFDNCAENARASAFEVINSKYAAAGYVAPTLTFWRLNVITKANQPAKKHSHAKLVSGFSPSLVKTILGGTSVTAYDTMLEVVDVERYTI